jgi:hypothetical protein
MIRNSRIQKLFNACSDKGLGYLSTTREGLHMGFSTMFNKKGIFEWVKHLKVTTYANISKISTPMYYMLKP